MISIFSISLTATHPFVILDNEIMSHLKKYQQFVASVFIFVCLLQVASSAQICEAFAEGTCPDDTCCNPDECRRENSPFRCCNDTTLDDCSNCALCSKYLQTQTFYPI